MKYRTFKEFLKYKESVKYNIQENISKCKELSKEEMILMGRDKNDWAFQWACSKGDLETAQILLNKGADIHKWEERALIWAKEYNQLLIIKWLIENGADINIASRREVCLAIWTCVKPKRKYPKELSEEEINWVEEVKQQYSKIKIN